MFMSIELARFDLRLQLTGTATGHTAAVLSLSDELALIYMSPVNLWQAFSFCAQPVTGNKDEVVCLGGFDLSVDMCC